MIKEYLAEILKLKLHKESFFTKAFSLGKFKIYPFYDLSVMISNSDESGVCSISPIAIVVLEFKSNDEVEYYLYYFDESKKSEEYNKIIIEKFCEDVLDLNN
nr:hypothetical protein [Methanobrevibacter arboriphilus]